MKKFLFLCLTIILCLNLTACKNSKKSENDDKKLLLVSFTILKDIVQNIAGNEFVVKSITKPGIEVHGYQTTPSDLIRGSKAILFIDNGFGFELWAEKFITNLDVTRVTIADYLDPILIDEDVYKGKPNPHAWISPKRGDTACSHYATWFSLRKNFC